VLVVRQPAGGLYGALGLSRKKELMYKPLMPGSLTAIIEDYRAAYHACGHHVSALLSSSELSLWNNVSHCAPECLTAAVRLMDENCNNYVLWHCSTIDGCHGK
jgi:hypothetical protein